MLKGIELKKEYEKKELYEKFKKEYEDFNPANGMNKLTQSRFSRWLKVWGKVKGMEVLESKSGSRRNIRFVEKEVG